MAQETEGAKSIGWVDCGTDSEGTQIYVNLLNLRHIQIQEPADPEDCRLLVTLWYVGVKPPIRLNVEHSERFLISAGLRQPKSEFIVVPGPPPAQIPIL